MKEWIKELCPEIADWQAELIAEHAQPKREWVGLTDGEIDSTFETQVWNARRSYARAIEAKLREKNGVS